MGSGRQHPILPTIAACQPIGVFPDTPAGCRADAGNKFLLASKKNKIRLLRRRGQVSFEAPMMNTLKKMMKIIDAISERTGRIVGWIAAPMIVALIYEVFARYVFHRPTIWSYEITYMIYGTHFLLGAAYTLRVKGHIRIDLLYMRFPLRGRALVCLLYTSDAADDN